MLIVNDPYKGGANNHVIVDTENRTKTKTKLNSLC